MKKISFLALPFACLLCRGSAAQAQTYSYQKALADTIAKYQIAPSPAPPTQANSARFEQVEVEASVDAQAWRRNLEKNLQAPIEKAAKKGMKAGYYIVLVRFLVEKDGSISDVRALNDPGYGLADASVKVVKGGPRWSAGEVNGKKVRSYHTQPLTFVIAEK